MPERIPQEVANAIRLVVLDVDGVLTDGGVYMGATADGTSIELKRFDITDQLGIKMLVWAGMEVALVSGRTSPANRLRAEELGIDWHEGPGGRKLEIVERLIERHGVSWSEIACVCDDLADLPILKRARLAVAVRNAVPEVRAISDWTTRREGGRGAVREFAETLLHARGQWAPLVADYLQAREAPVS